MGSSEGGSEDAFHALQEFCETPQSRRQLSQSVEDTLVQIAKTGEVLYPWNLLKPALESKLAKVFQEFFESSSFPDADEALRNHDEMKTVILDRLAWFDRAPFTIQRLCELVVWPKNHYTRCDKYMRGLIKVLKVVSTIGPPVCNGSTHAISTEPCNGNSSLLNRHESAATLSESSHVALGSTSSMSGEDDTFSSFNLSPRHLPSPYSPPLSPGADDRPTWGTSSARPNEDNSEGDSDSSLDNTQSTVELGEGPDSPGSPQADSADADDESAKMAMESTTDSSTSDAQDATLDDVPAPEDPSGTVCEEEAVSSSD